MDDYIECEGRLQGCLSDGESGFEKLMEGGDAAEKEEEEILLHYGFLLLTLKVELKYVLPMNCTCTYDRICVWCQP